MPAAPVPVRSIFRGSPEYATKVRMGIRAHALVKRLSEHALTRKGSPGYEAAMMTQGQITAALGLLKKVVPDLLAAQITGEVTVVHQTRETLRAAILGEAEDVSGRTTLAEAEGVDP